MWEKDWLEKEGHLEKVNNEFFVERGRREIS